MFKFSSYSKVYKITTKRDPSIVILELEKIITEDLKKYKANNIKSSNHHITFESGMLNFTSTTLRGISKGSFKISSINQEITLNHKIHFIETLFFYIFISLCAMFIVPMPFKLFIPIILFLISYSSTTTLSIFRFNNFIKKIIKESTLNEPLEISKEQLSWINDKDKCPACGNTVSETDTECSDCNLTLD